LVNPTAVGHPFDGVYCISGLPFTPNNAVVSLDSDGLAVGDNVELKQAFGCPAATQISVFTFTIKVSQTTMEVDNVNDFIDAANGFWININ
jgi:hypothetical protein